MCKCGNCLSCCGPGDSITLDNGVSLPVVRVNEYFVRISYAPLPDAKRPTQTKRKALAPNAFGASVRDERKRRGMTLTALSRQTGFSASWICAIERSRASGGYKSYPILASALGIECPPMEKRNQGENHPLSKITEAQATEILARIARGDRLKDIAPDFHVHPSRISMIKTGRGWGHLPRPGKEGGRS